MTDKAAAAPDASASATEAMPTSLRASSSGLVSANDQADRGNHGGQEYEDQEVGVQPRILLFEHLLCAVIPHQQAH